MCDHRSELMKRLLLPLLLGLSLLTGCTTLRLPNGARLITPAEMKNVTFTPTTFHADEISHAGIARTLQQLFTMAGVGAFLP